ncbi:transcriptional regulator GcvA [Bradyrhizobium mercantei]|uniref:transcriptional regulator GcvA n=1 Tax=Bradyrhizobium mercantei TaxID=1904807 RepID=UPI000978374B|nr:transcriptional regulator GcvA [Bradyrhizobium mercantei]
MSSSSYRARQLPPLTSLRAFEVAARHMSLTVAASELNVTQSAISRQIRNLEDFLDVELFKRLPRSLELTVEGARLAAQMHEAFELLYQATESMQHQSRPTTLTINVLPTFAMKWLIPRLLHFTADNPNIEVRMINSIRPVDFGTEETDIAIRVAPSSKYQHQEKSPIDLVMTQDWSGVRSIPFIPDTLVAVCSPTLLKKGPPLDTPADLRHYKLLHVATREKSWRYFLQSCGLNPSEFGNFATYGHFFMTIQAAIEGNGVALVPSIFIESELKSGLLVPLFGSAGFEAGAYYFLSRTSLWETSKIVKFREWLIQEAGAKSEVGSTS